MNSLVTFRAFEVKRTLLAFSESMLRETISTVHELVGGSDVNKEPTVWHQRCAREEVNFDSVRDQLIKAMFMSETAPASPLCTVCEVENYVLR